MIDNSTGKITFERKATSPSETVVYPVEAPDGSTMASSIHVDKDGNMTVLITSNEASTLLKSTGLNISYDINMNHDGLPWYEVTLGQNDGFVFGYGFNPREAGESIFSLWESKEWSNKFTASQKRK